MNTCPIVITIRYMFLHFRPDNVNDIATGLSRGHVNMCVSTAVDININIGDIALNYFSYIPFLYTSH
jgi:hypothetical protein